MLKLLSLEYKKFKNNAVVDLFGIMFMITMPTVLFIGKEFKNVPPPLPNNAIFFNFPGVWDYLGYTGNWLVFFFLGFIVMYMVTSEVGFKTMRQNIITGLSRRDYFLSKLYVVIALSVFATLFYTVVALLIGYFHAEPHSLEGAFENEMAIPRYFLMCLGYLSFALMVALLIRSSGIAIFAYVSYILFIELILKWSVHFKIAQQFDAINPVSINYWPMNAIEDLMPFPPYTFVENLPRKDLDFAFLLSNNQAIVTSIVYISIFICVSYYSFMKRDI